MFLFVFLGYIMKMITREYQIPSNLIFIYSESPKTTFFYTEILFFSNSIEINNITLRGKSFQMISSFKNCDIILPQPILFENQKNIEFYRYFHSRFHFSGSS